MNIHIHNIPRIEGHLSLYIELDEQLRKCNSVTAKAVEGPRFFEILLCHRKYYEVPLISSRICGVCGYAHTICAAKAVENAMDIEVSENTTYLRELALKLNTIESHILHAIVFMLPDYYGEKYSIIKSIKFEHSIRDLLYLKSIAGKILKVIFGDRVHARNIIPGGIVHLDNSVYGQAKDLANEMVKNLSAINEILYNFSKLVNNTKYYMPSYDSNFVALKNSYYKYFINGDISINNAFAISPREYKKYFIESSVSYSTSKKILLLGNETFMVGALSRINININNLCKEARELLTQIEIEIPSTNPFLIPMAQLIEIYDSVLKVYELIDKVKLVSEYNRIKPRDGEGYAAIEAPRGLLYYHVKLNREGTIDLIDIVTPTTQNIADMERCIKYSINHLLSSVRKTEMKNIVNIIKDLSETIVRSYDPCISCAVHIVLLKNNG